MAHLPTAASSSLHWNHGTRFAPLSYQVAEIRRIYSATAKCSDRTDLRLIFIDPVYPCDLPQRPSLTFMPLAAD